MEDTKKTYFDGEKVKALRTRIVEECKRQGFTVREFNMLVKELEIDYWNRYQKVDSELF